MEAIVNYIALLGWSPADNTEIFSLKELEETFDIAGLSKSPSIFDIKKLTWMNGEYMKAMDFEKFFTLAEPKLAAALEGTDVDLRKIAALLQKRLETWNDIPAMVGFFKELPEYGTELYTHKKMKTNDEIALASLEAAVPVLEGLADWNETAIHDALIALARYSGQRRNTAAHAEGYRNAERLKYGSRAAPSLRRPAKRGFSEFLLNRLFFVCK